MSDGTTTWTNTYNADGMRIRRTDGTKTYQYIYDGSNLTYMNVDGNHLRFAHTPDGAPLSIVYNNATYYYVTNLQGDVVAILNRDGDVQVEYTYDAWGKVLSVTGPKRNTLGKLNPIRYRGYVYDHETNLYYLQSRYYDPQVGRFVNADAFNATGQGLIGNNMFAYCNNNPVMLADSTGTRPVLSTSLRNETEDDKNISFAHMNKRDITEKLNEAMRENAVEFGEYCEDHNYVDSSPYFANQVKLGGDWDFKSQDDWMLKSNTTYIYNGTELRYDDVGNIHYGYVGRVLFSTDMLLLMGGVVQIYAGTSSWSYKDTYFDDPRDQWAIQFGCTLWDTEALS